MSKRLSPPCAAAATIIFTLGAHAHSAAQSGVEANGPVSLPETLAVTPNSKGDASAVAPNHSAAVAASAHESLKSIAPPSANEHRPLGPPPKPSQSVNDIAGAPTQTGLLQTIDPRSNDVTKVIGALAVVVGLILLLRVLLRKSGGFLAGGGKPSGVVEILAKYPVGRAQHIVLLKIARRIVLLHQSGSSMTTLSEMTDPDEVAGLLTRMEAGSTERDAERFRKTLTQFMAEHEAPHERAGRARRVQMPLAETEVVDLTRTRRGLASMLGRRSGGA